MMKDEESPDENVEAFPTAQADSIPDSVSDESTVWDRARRVDEELFFSNFERPAEDLPTEHLRDRIVDYVRDCPGQTLKEIAEVFAGYGYRNVTIAKVRAALKDDEAVDHNGLPPIALRTMRGQLTVYGWQFPADAGELSEYLRACLASTLGDIYSIRALLGVAQDVWGNDAMAPTEAATLIWRLWGTAEATRRGDSDE